MVIRSTIGRCRSDEAAVRIKIFNQRIIITVVADKIEMIIWPNCKVKLLRLEARLISLSYRDAMGSERGVDRAILI